MSESDVAGDQAKDSYRVSDNIRQQILFCPPRISFRRTSDKKHHKADIIKTLASMFREIKSSKKKCT